VLLAFLLSGENADTQRQGKEGMAWGILLEKLSQLSRTGQNGGFSWQQGGTSPNLLNPALPGGLSVEEAYAALQSAGLSPQMIQEVLESNGYFVENLLELPPAAGTGAGLGSQVFSGLPGNSGYFPENLLELPGASAYEPLFTTLGRAGLEQSVFQGLMKNNGFSMENALARPSAQQAYNILKAEGFSPETSRYLLESNGYRLDDTSQLPDLLDDDEEDLLQRKEVGREAFEEFEIESDEIEGEEGGFLENEMPLEVIEFDKKYTAVSESELLPNVKEAVLTEKKFTGYFLDPTHPTGGHKAIVFEKVLGYNKSNWRELRSKIQQGILKYRRIERLGNSYGQKFEVRMIIKGPTGRCAKVKTGWIIDEGEVNPRIVSAYIYK